MRKPLFPRIVAANSRLDRWHRRHTMRLGTSVAAASVLALSAAAFLLLAPSIGLLTITKRLGVQSGTNLHLPAAGIAAIGLLLAAMFIAARLLGGYAKAFCAPRYMSWPWLLMLGFGGVGSIMSFAIYVGDAVAQVHPRPDNDNAVILVFFAAWIWILHTVNAPVVSHIDDRLKAWWEKHTRL